MGDGTEFDDEAGWDKPNKKPRPVFYGIVGDVRKWPSSVKPDAIWELVDQVFEPNPLRSHVITLHLYLEYWLDKLLAQAKLSARGTFSKKVARLQDKGALSGITYDNIVAVNRIRNLYAHELDLGKVEPEVESLLVQLKLDKNFTSTDEDHLRTICFQTMFMLDATWANGGVPPGVEPYPHEQVRAKLLAEGTLFWQECEKLEH